MAAAAAAAGAALPRARLEFQKFASRRSVVHSAKGIVACTQPLAAQCGLKVLEKGGNAADAAVAVAAGLNVTEPGSTGIGGDMFLLYYDAATKKVSAMNGSGRSPAGNTLETVRSEVGAGDRANVKIPLSSVHAATVPGAAAGWVDTLERFGSGVVNMGDVLGPAIALAEGGFPVSELSASAWQASEAAIRAASPNYAEILKKDPSAPSGCRAPRPGEIMRNPTLAQTFRAVVADGKAGFYTGRVAEAIVEVCRAKGGFMTLEDLDHHMKTGSEPVEAISLKFRGQGLGEEGGLEIWEHPPNGQGIVALMTLGMIQELEKKGTIPTWSPSDFNTAPYLHTIIECLRLAFSDATWFVADPNVVKVPSSGLLDAEYLAKRAELFRPDRAGGLQEHGTPRFVSPALNSSDTVYFAVSDAQGNAASFIISNYHGFGTSIVPRGCGFTLQNRGANFSLDPDHPNAIAPRKRPYHTIIPGMVTKLSDGGLHSAFGVMGAFMQPQGHVQVLLGQVVGDLNPQQALDAPRICIDAGVPEDGKEIDWTVNVEEGMPEETVEGLRALGHNVKIIKGMGRALFGRGQIVRHHVDPIEGTQVWSAGSDMRGDGAAYPF